MFLKPSRNPVVVFAFSLLVLALMVDEIRSDENRSTQTRTSKSQDAAAPAMSLPGAEPYNPALRQRMAAMSKQRGAAYLPRTRHLQADGSAKYTNRLFLETSPYLLQHAHNPVDWYPWGDEAFERARELGRPVLLSVGYSTCHWCHVMEEESFEDEEIARFLNQHYVVIKVDREERPDVDAIYMSAVQTLTGHGGWPMTVWLTADRKPFYGGTYFPARDGDRGTRSGFLSLLQKLSEAYHQQPDKVAESSEALSQAIRQMLAPPLADAEAGAAELPQADLLARVAGLYRQRFDSRYGGLEGAPKFPSSLPVRLLLRQYRHSGDKTLLDMATLTLRQMAAGGMRDQVGGGFHRYSTDQRWLVPHFEKMLYDNALLAVSYLEAFQVTGDAGFRRVTEDILCYVMRDMTSPEGAFYSATDADSPLPADANSEAAVNADGKVSAGHRQAPTVHREEGWFFTWTPEEIDRALDPTLDQGFDPQAAALVKQYFQVTEAGNFEGRNILHTAESLATVANHLELPVAEAETLLAQAREQLYRVRSQRPPPLRDEKILSAWNGLMISAFARAGMVLDRPDYTGAAVTAARFVLDELLVAGKLYRSYKDGQARHAAYLDDYAFLIAALLDLYEATSDIDWLRQALVLDQTLEQAFEDKSQGGFFMTAQDHEKLLAREKPSYDGAEPSGNSVALLNLLRLHEFTTDDRFRQRAEKALQAFASALKSRPFALSEMLLALDFHIDQAKQIIIVTPPGDKAGAVPLLAALRRQFLPNRILSVVEQGSELQRQARFIPLLEGKTALKGKPTAYVCEQGICQLPTSDAAVFARQIAKVTPLPEQEP